MSEIDYWKRELIFNLSFVKNLFVCFFSAFEEVFVQGIEIAVHIHKLAGS
jgi:hypothetical protein